MHKKSFAVLLVLIVCVFIQGHILSASSWLSQRAVTQNNHGRELCTNLGFFCVYVKKNDTWTSLWPNYFERQLVMSLNRMNIPLAPGMVLAVPDDLATADLMKFAPFDAKIAPPKEKLVIVDPVAHAWGAYNARGELVRWGPASGGDQWCNDLGRACRTPVGTFRVYAEGSSECISSKFPIPTGGAPMPYCMYFHGGMALHGEPVGVPGFNASHGCVRLFVADAEWLRFNFIEAPNASNHYKGTKVIIEPYAQKRK